jgi:Flp pilus assembly protein TadG
MTKMHILKAFRDNEDGIAAVEFGLIGSVFITLLLGGFDLGHTMYMNTVLEGALQSAARNSALQTGSVASKQAALDANVSAQIRRLNKTANVVFTRRFYKSFTAARDAKHENDINTLVPAKNNNGKCETGESYLDVNNNGSYDTDGGNGGQGGAQDTVIYKASISYPRMFPYASVVGLSSNVKLSASTVMQNQPYSAQSQYGPATTRTCP